MAKELHLIEQWGTGFQKLSDELKEYPEIELRINEPGLSFQIQFIKKDYHSEKGEDHTGTKLEPHWEQVDTKLGLNMHASATQVEVLMFCSEPRTRIEIHSKLEMKNLVNMCSLKFLNLYWNKIYYH